MWGIEEIFITKILFVSLSFCFMENFMKGVFMTKSEEEIKSTGFVLHTLEASLWCILNTNSYRDAVLRAVNLGDDTDTTAAVTGGLAGIIYGFDEIPRDWIDKLKNKNLIEDCLFKKILLKLLRRIKNYI